MRQILFFVFLITSFTVSTADAHIELIEPTARYPIATSGENKACPCGVGESNRLCDIPTDRSDPDRSDRITTIAAGSTITVRFDEYVAHSGRIRLAFDFDGADLDDFNANILLDVPDPPGNMNDIGTIWELQVQLPDQSCDNCTLQLLQMMDGNTTDPVLDPVGRSSYYACADLVLTDGTGNPDAGSGGGESGGGCQTTGGSSVPGWGLLFTLGLMLGLRRRRRR